MVKKVGVCSDIHDDLEALAKFCDFAQAQEWDRIYCAGDLELRAYTPDMYASFKASTDVTTFLDAAHQFNTMKLRDAKALFDATEIPFYVVPGNYDPLLEEVFGNHDIHMTSLRHKDGVTIVGYGGADKFPPPIQMMSELGAICKFDHDELLSVLMKEKPDIAIIHNPPYGLCDDLYDGKNVGTRATRQFMFECSPEIIISGHIHEAGPLGANPNGCQGIAAAQSRDGHTTYVVNPGNLGRFELIVDKDTLATYKPFDFGTFAELHINDDGELERLIQYRMSNPDRTFGEIKVIGDYTMQS